MFFLSVYFLNFFFCFINCIFSSASFYGDSFTFEQVTDFSSESTVSIQFQTRLSNGMLLTAIGQHDYLTISLNNGRIQVRIRAGANEGILKSPHGVHYNDQLWHQLNVIRLGSKVNIVVNGNDVASENLWVNNGILDVLKINLGVFLGGYDESVTASHFDVSHPFFRGCIINAVYNGVDVLHPLHNVPDQKIVYNIKPGYSRIFRAHQNEPMNVDSPHAYVKYHRWTGEAEGSFDCRVKTLGQSGLILYNSGWKRQTYVGLEMISGTVRGSLNKGSGVVALQSIQTINDGKWHRIKFTFTSSYLEIRIGRNRTKVYIEHDNDDKIDDSYSEIKLKGPLFVGGIIQKLKSSRSLKTTGLNLKAFPGCIKSVRVNYRPKSFDDILASHDVTVGCKSNQSRWSDLVPNPPSYPTFVIVPRSPDHPHLTSNKPHRVEPERTAEQSKTNVLKTICFVIRSRNVTVDEGAAFDVTPDVLKFLTLNASKLLSSKNIPVLVQVTETLSHGALYRNGSKLSLNDSFACDSNSNQFFSLHHDGSEAVRDQFSLRIEVFSTKKSRQKLIYRLCDDRQRVVDHANLTFYVNVTPVDDAPTLEIPTSYIFRPVRNARTPLPKHIFNATDSDSAASNIVYHVLGLGTGLYVENDRNSGRPVSVFTQSDVDLDHVNFVHAGGPRNARLLLQVTNPDMSFDIAQTSHVVRISAIDLQIKVVNNTGITLVEGESSLISSNHLSSMTNAGSSLVDVLYEIISPPTRGKLEVLLGEDETSRAWVATSSFRQSQLMSRRVKYTNDDLDLSNDAVISDRFVFRVSGAETDFGPFIFNVTLLKVRVSVDASPVILRNGSDSAVLSTSFLIVHYSGLENVSDGEIQFVVVKSFGHADILYRDTGLRVSTDDAFTLSDLMNKRLLVRVAPDSAATRVSALFDHVTLAAVVRGRYRSPLVSLNLTYIPDIRSVKITSSPLLVDEGGEAEVSAQHLNARTLLHQRFLFHVVMPPKSGALALRRPTETSSDSFVERHSNVTSFTWKDIIEGRLFYRHDDSERNNDVIQFSVVPILEGELPETVRQLRNVSARGSLNISIRLVNDNAPVRVVNKPFEVVRNEQRLLTRNDLWYHDPDVDQDDLDLKYVRRGISNGEIVDAASKKKIFEFTQRDMMSNKVLFRHKKADFGRFVFWVRDGKNFATGLFVVKASEAYLNVNSSKVLVEKGGSSTVSGNNLQVETNLVGLRSSIKYRVVHPPVHGQLCLGNQSRVTNFTQNDVDNGVLQYHHGTSPDMDDGFTFTVNVKDKSAVGSLRFQMFLASLQQPPIIRRNRVILVHQSRSVPIDRSHLRATHQDVRPRDITFTLRKHPTYGYFLLNRSVSVDGAMVHSPPIKNPSTFSQWDVNQGYVSYVQNSNMTLYPITRLDNFTFDVSNGILSLASVKGQVEIIPVAIPLRVANFSVGEGRSRVLIREYLDVPNRHFDDLGIEIHVIEQPSNGMLARDPGKRLDEFSLRLVRAELLSYTHDGSDTIADSFRLRASSADGTRQSNDVTVYVAIVPDNDQAPKIVNNSGLLVWINSMTLITPSELAASDLDSPPEELVFKILPPQNGHLAMTSLPGQAISTFTQRDINEKKVAFVHKGSSTGGFTFQVDDGRNFDNKQIFVITARLLILTLIKNSSVQVFPSTLSLVAMDNLLASTNDEEPRDITFDIIRAPSRGEILKRHQDEGAESARYSRVSSFTQSDVDAGLIVYNQSEELLNWNSTDFVRLNVMSFPAENVSDVTLTFDISYDNYRLVERSSPVKVNKGAKIPEGSSFNFTLSNLDASNLINRLEESKRSRYVLRYRIVSAPEHGGLHVGGRWLGRNDSFPHRFIERRIVNYTHDDSEDERDRFLFEVFLQHKSVSDKIHPFTVRDHFNITLIPVDDNPPKLVTKKPHLETVRGHVTTLDSSLLQALDIDSPPGDVRFNVIRAPSYGRIKSTSTGENVSEFTQQDLNARTLSFEQNDELDASAGNVTISDAFYFSLSDGLHRPSYSLFMIKIFPVSVRFSTGQIFMKQGEVSHLLSSRDLHVTTNADVRLIYFVAVKPAVAGSLYLGSRPVTSFAYEDLIASRVTYVMSNLNHDSDHMTFMARYNSSHDHVNETDTLHVTILPRVTISNDFQVPSNSIVNIPVAALDASQLANFSFSQPIYDIITEPKHAELLILGRKRNTSVRNSPSSITFSHEDVTSGHLYLDVKSVNVSNVTSLRDQFKFRLRVEDGSVQPAAGVFPFTIIPLNSSAEQNNTSDNSTYSEFLSSFAFSTVGRTLTSAGYFSTSSITSQPRATVAMTTVSVKIDGSNVEKAEDHDYVYSWLLPLLIALCVVVFVIIIIICVFICLRRSKHPTYVKGQESPTLKATFSPPANAPYLENSIDANTVVRVTSSRVDTGEVPQQCPTAAVVVTPLRKSMYYVADDEPFDDSYYGDGYMSNSMPPDGHLSGMQKLSVPSKTVSSPHGLHGDAGRSSDDYSPFLGADDAEFSTGEESFDSGENAQLTPKRNNSSASLSLRSKQLSTPRSGVQQYWI